jgi:putative restriction endonuclease
MNDLQIRMFAFDWLRNQAEIYGNILPRKILTEGFSLSGESYSLVGPQGIWKPQLMKLPVSITSLLGGRYTDTIDENQEIFEYKYRGTNPFHRDNSGLRELMNRKIPLICFLRIAINKYVPLWPAFIIKENPVSNSFSVVFDDLSYFRKQSKLKTAAEPEVNYARREYITVTALRRVHQQKFREKVLNAYRNQCTLCRLRHSELLDAAHIIGDKEDHGEPVVENGLSLCKIHHSAFDQNIIGITPDFNVKVRSDVLEEIDGPMLKYGLQLLNNAKLSLPLKKENWPDKERLEFRYKQFQNAW